MKNFLDRARLFFSKDKEFRTALYQIMGFYPHNVEIYRVAFAHKSQEYRSKKTGNKPLNNERLEFLGDAVLETVVSDIVYHHFKNKREGFLTNTRAKIVSRESLGRLAKDLGIDRLIQSHTHSRAHNSYIGGNSFEALMGAIYLDRGFHYAFRFVEKRIIGAVLDLEGVAQKEVNFKSKLLEWSQKNRIRLEFKESHNGNNQGNNSAFSTQIIIEGIWAGEGKGFSKKESHQNASKDALTQLRRAPDFVDRILRSKEKRTAMEAGEFFVLPKIDEIEAELANEQKALGERKRTEKNKKGQDQRRERQERSERNERSERRQERDEKARPEQPKQEQPKAEQAKRENKRDKATTKAEANGECPSRKPSKDNDRNEPKPQKAQQQKPSQPKAEEAKQQPAPETEKATSAKVVTATASIAITAADETTATAPLSTTSEQETLIAEPPTTLSTPAATTSSTIATPNTEETTQLPESDVQPAEAVDFIPLKMVDLAEQQDEKTEQEQPEAEQQCETTAPETPIEEDNAVQPLPIATPREEAVTEPSTDLTSTPETTAGAADVAATPQPHSDEVADSREETADCAPATDTNVEETTTLPDDATDTAEETADSSNAKRKSRRKGRRTQASAFANTTLPPAEQSHRAEKAKRKQAEQQRERAKQKAREALFDADEHPADAPEAEHDTQEPSAREGRQRQGRQQRQRRPDQRRQRQDSQETTPDDTQAREALIAQAEAEAYGEA